jgi:hypothetical protein
MVNWKTTLFGGLSAVFLFLGVQLQEFKGLFDSLSAVCLALMALFAKDSNVTGGTTPNK